MAVHPSVVTVDMVSEAKELTPAAAREYFRASLRVVPFLEQVIRQIETAMKARTGFSAEHPPKTRCKSSVVTLDDIAFSVTTKRTTKTPSYQAVVGDLNGYLAFLAEEKEAGKQVPCVRTFDGNHYVKLGDVLSHIAEYRDRVLEEGLSQSIDGYTHSSLFTPHAERLVVPLADFSALPPGSGVLYVNASAFVERAKARAIRPFEEALKRASGYSRSSMPDKTETTYVPVGEHLFCVQSIPSENPSYTAILNALVYTTPEGKRTRRTGELTLVRMCADDPRVSVYDPRERDGEKYVSLFMLQKRIAELTREHTKPELRQHIHPYPVV